MERLRLPLEEIFIVSVVLLLLPLLLHVEDMSLHGDVMEVNVEQDFDDTSFDVAASKPNASVWWMMPQDDSTAAETAAAVSAVVFTIRRGREGIVCSK